MGVAEQAYRKRDAKASMARQGGLRPNMRHVQRGIRTFPFVLDVAGENPIQSPDSPPSVIQDGWGGCSSCSDGLRSDINEDHAEHGPAQAYVVKGTKCAIALVAQWIERPPPERKATSPILVEGTHENSANHNAWSPSSLLSHAVAPRTVRASRGNALVAQRIERRFPKPGVAGPTPAGGTSAAFDGLALSKNRNHWSPDRPPS